MEGEFADIKDRNLMGLYGSDKSKPEPIDHTKSSRFIEKANKNKEDEDYNDKGVGNDYLSLDINNNESNKSIHVKNTLQFGIGSPQTDKAKNVIFDDKN